MRGASFSGVTRIGLGCGLRLLRCIRKDSIAHPVLVGIPEGKEEEERYCAANVPDHLDRDDEPQPKEKRIAQDW